MKAWIIREPGGPEQFCLEDIEVPKARAGWTLIRIRAYGLNRSEWFTRVGDSPSVKFPRVLGIECVGEVVDSGGLNLAPGTTVAAIMGGMGREFHGSYAEYTLVPHSCVFPVETGLPWEGLAAFPEMLQTTHGSLFEGLEIDRADSLLIRGGTSSIGMAALAIAKSTGLRVGTTTRNPTKVNELKKAGADWDWNEIQIRANGPEIEIKINGVSTAKYTEKGNVPLSGSICLQAHSGGPYEVWYKDIRLKPLK